MKFYLRVINPALALISFGLCLYASIVSERDLEIDGLVVGGMNTYFFAKGIFTAITIFLLGKVVERMLCSNDNGSLERISIKEIAILISVFMLFTFSFGGVYLATEEDYSSITEISKIVDEDVIAIKSYHPVSQSKNLKIAATLENYQDRSWFEVIVHTELYLDGKLADIEKKTLNGFKSKEKQNIIIEFASFSNEEITDSISCLFKIEAK